MLAAEVRRTAAKGAHAVTFSENPSKLGWPSFHTDHWDPFWQACSDEDVVVCLHIGSSSQLVITAPDAPIDCLITLTPMNIVQAAADLVWSPVLRKFPDLKVALSEGGIGWIPYFLERIDYNYGRHHAWTGQDFGDKLPSEVFNEHVLTCFIDDKFGVASREFLNMDNVMWECDYPHSRLDVAVRPRDAWRAASAACRDHDIDRITHLNAMKHFSYDPFTVLGGKENCTVGAPARHGQVGHDVAIKSVRPDMVGAHAALAADLYSPRAERPAGDAALGRRDRRGEVDPAVVGGRDDDVHQLGVLGRVLPRQGDVERQVEDPEPVELGVDGFW